MLKELGVFEYHPRQRERFVSGELWHRWAEDYPDIFDERDVQIAKNQAGQDMRLHFHEWLAAVLLFQTYGFLSLVEQYEFKVQARKQAVMKHLLPPDVFALVTNHSAVFGKVQCPDLLTFSPDHSDWFFCEVKGPHDRLSESQMRFFKELAQVSGKDIRIVRFRTEVALGSA